MRVCILTTAFPRWAGDSHAPFVFELARSLHLQGMQVRVIAMHCPGASTYEVMDGVEVIRPRYLPERYEILRKESAGLPALWQKNPLLRLAILPFLLVQTVALLRYARDCDLIHAQWTLSGMLVWITRWLHRKPYLVTVHGSDIFKAAKTPWIRGLTRAALNSSVQVIAVSQALAQAVRDLRVQAEKVTVISDGVDTSKFYPTNEERLPIILYVGALTEQKGVEYLLRAFPRVAADFPEMRLVLIGEGAQRKALEALAGELGIEDRVEWVGAQPQSEVARLMRQARLFVLPSVNEGLGVVVLEALASGLPCVGSRSGGIPDMITGEVGRLVEPKDSPGLAEAMLQILGSPVTYQQMSACARQRAVQRFEWRSVASEHARLYQLLSGK